MTEPVVETLHGKRHTYEIRVARSSFQARFAVYRDGVRWKGDYPSVVRAVEAIGRLD